MSPPTATTGSGAAAACADGAAPVAARANAVDVVPVSPEAASPVAGATAASVTTAPAPTRASAYLTNLLDISPPGDDNEQFLRGPTTILGTYRHPALKSPARE